MEKSVYIANGKVPYVTYEPYKNSNRADSIPAKSTMDYLHRNLKIRRLFMLNQMHQLARLFVWTETFFYWTK